jgi:hypothetical protein
MHIPLRISNSGIAILNSKFCKQDCFDKLDMQIGMIGLGRMGGNMARRLAKGGHRCVVFASTAFDFLSSTATDRSLRHARDRNRVFSSGIHCRAYKLWPQSRCGCFLRGFCKAGIFGGSRRSAWPLYALLALALH